MAASRPGRGLSARQLVGAVALASVFPILGGCQTGMGVSALNDCRQTVEAKADSVRGGSVGWTRIEPRQRGEVVATPKDTERLYVQVRRSKEQPPVQFTVTVADLAKPPKGVDDDVEIVLEGDRCPAVAG